MNYELDPLGLITLSFRQTLKRILLWGRLTVWRIAFSIPLVTWGAAKAAYYQAIAEALRDPFDQDTNPREAFVRAFFDQAGRGTAVAALNLAALFIIVFGMIFWMGQEQFYLNLLAGIALPFLLLWWMCQPYLYPILVERPARTVPGVFREAVRQTIAHPGFSFVCAFSLTWFFLIAIPLVGPLSLLTIPFLALVCTQSHWIAAGMTVPDLVDPIQYAEQREARAAAKAADADAGT